jgi:hypothetical protein
MNWIIGVFFVVGLLVFAWAHKLGFIVAVGTGALMLFGGGLWILGVAFHEGVMCGVMYLFVPFYGLYYLISRWDDCKRPFGLAVGGWLLVFAAALLNPEIMLEQGRDEAQDGMAGMPILPDGTPFPPGLLPEFVTPPWFAFQASPIAMRWPCISEDKSEPFRKARARPGNPMARKDRSWR